MSLNWYYEYDGKKVGPIPSQTLRHLAVHGAIKPQTRIWRDGLVSPVSASCVKDLFDRPIEASLVPEESVETATTYLKRALDACRDEDDERLASHVPHIAAIHPFSISHVLLSYEVLRVTKLPTPAFDASVPLPQRTKEVKQLFEAVVNVELCQRPPIRMSVERIRALRPGAHCQTIVYECKEFVDGDWIFLHADLVR